MITLLVEEVTFGKVVGMITWLVEEVTFGIVVGMITWLIEEVTFGIVVRMISWFVELVTFGIVVGITVGIVSITFDSSSDTLYIVLVISLVEIVFIFSFVVSASSFLF